MLKASMLQDGLIDGLFPANLEHMLLMAWIDLEKIPDYYAEQLLDYPAPKRIKPNPAVKREISVTKKRLVEIESYTDEDWRKAYENDYVEMVLYSGENGPPDVRKYRLLIIERLQEQMSRYHTTDPELIELKEEAALRLKSAAEALAIAPGEFTQLSFEAFKIDYADKARWRLNEATEEWDKERAFALALNHKLRKLCASMPFNIGPVISPVN